MIDRDATQFRFPPGKLILGGHSFISPLGNDVEASEDEQHAIVTACLANDITVFDTTYAPERTAWARAICQCSSHEVARAIPIIWNFFGPLTEPLPGPKPWDDARLDEALSELSPWSGKPMLVVHDLPDQEANLKQIAAVRRWKDAGRVAGVGHWPGFIKDWTSPDAAVWDFVIAPWNVKSAGRARDAFAAAKNAGRATVGTSPFTRGWELDRIATTLAGEGQIEINAARAKVADAMLRFSAFSPEVDHVVVAMRSAKYVARNVGSLRRGKLSGDELNLIDA